MKISTLAWLSLTILTAAPPLAAQPAAGPEARRTAGTAPASATLPDYRLVTGDKLRIEIYKEPQLSQSLQVRPDGRITLPLIGDIVAAGQTPSALRDAIGKAYQEYINNPVVTVIVVEAQTPTISVMGEVNEPGVQPLKHQMTVIDALAIAGGFKDFADTKRILVKRNTASGVETIPFNYREAIKSNSKPMYLQPGDVIIVP